MNSNKLDRSPVFDCPPGNSVLIVIATYNELDNLPGLVSQIFESMPECRILVIDDASPDGTGKWCDVAKNTYPKLEVLHRKGKLGLGSGAITGLKIGLERDFDFVATLDADFSHDPKSLIKLLDACKTLAESDVGVAIGSRYVAGGRIEGWPWYRRLVSRAVNAYSRLLLQLPTADNSGAFRVYRTEALRKIDFNDIHSNGYGYLEEILFHLHQADVPLVEVPITFRDRTSGKSKTSLLTGLGVFWRITLLGLRR
jgi:dolichol-phosphate mannosyltransferase